MTEAKVANFAYSFGGNGGVNTPLTEPGKTLLSFASRIQVRGREIELSLGFATLQIFQRIPVLARAAVSARRTRAAAAALTLILVGTTSLQNAAANGDTRTIYLENAHTGESGAFTFKKEGRYDDDVLKKLNWFLRDWRKAEPTKMDPELFDLLWEVYRDVGAKEEIQVLCGYRSPSTNAMLRSRSKAVAEQSQHVRGRAMDFFIPGVNLAELRAAGLRMQRGGVGFYPSNNFVHMDTGSVRMWPRMTHDQLVKVFPDEKTVHVPADGKPLANYQQALAELEGGKTVAVAQGDAGAGIRKFFASLFSGKTVDEEEDEEVSPAAAKLAARSKAAEVKVASAAPPEETPAPVAAPIKVATKPLPVPRPAEITAAIITAQAVVAPLPTAPLPLRRPMPADAVFTASVAPFPAPFPAVITRGSQTAPEGTLSYAPSSGDLDARRPLSQEVIAAPALQARQRSKTAEVPFGRLFVAPSLTTEPYLRPPELRVFTAFMTAPRQVVATGFSSDATRGLSTSHFSGTAMASLPVYVFGPPNIQLTQRVP